MKHFIALLALLVPTLAAAQGNLVLYCAPQEEWCRAMVTAFERKTGVKVAMTRKSSGEIDAQIKAEASNPRGDVWWGGTGDPHLQAAEEGLTEAYKSPKMTELQEWAVRPWEEIGEHTSELQSPCNIVCRLLLEKKKMNEKCNYFYIYV